MTPSTNILTIVEIGMRAATFCRELEKQEKNIKLNIKDIKNAAHMKRIKFGGS
jgi:hypothetical protein